MGQSDALGHTSTYVYDEFNRLAATVSAEGVATVRGYDELGRVVTTTNGLGNRTRVTEILTLMTCVITNVYDALNRLTGSEYSSSESFAYVHDALGNRTLATSTTPLSGTVVTTYTYDAANRLTDHVRSDGRFYILRAEPQDKAYTWSNRGQLLAEWAPEIPVT